MYFAFELIGFEAGGATESNGEPSVAESSGASDGGAAVAANPDGWPWLLDGLG